MVRSGSSFRWGVRPGTTPAGGYFSVTGSVKLCNLPAFSASCISSFIDIALTNVIRLTAYVCVYFRCDCCFLMEVHSLKAWGCGNWNSHQRGCFLCFFLSFFKGESKTTMEKNLLLLMCFTIRRLPLDHP